MRRLSGLAVLLSVFSITISIASPSYAITLTRLGKVTGESREVPACDGRYFVWAADMPQLLNPDGTTTYRMDIRVYDIVERVQRSLATRLADAADPGTSAPAQPVILDGRVYYVDGPVCSAETTSYYTIRSIDLVTGVMTTVAPKVEGETVTELAATGGIVSWRASHMTWTYHPATGLVSKAACPSSYPIAGTSLVFSREWPLSDPDEAWDYSMAMRDVITDTVTGARHVIVDPYNGVRRSGVPDSAEVSGIIAVLGTKVYMELAEPTLMGWSSFAVYDVSTRSFKLITDFAAGKTYNKSDEKYISAREGRYYITGPDNDYAPLRVMTVLDASRNFLWGGMIPEEITSDNFAVHDKRVYFIGRGPTGSLELIKASPGTQGAYIPAPKPRSTPRANTTFWVRATPFPQHSDSSVYSSSGTYIGDSSWFVAKRKVGSSWVTYLNRRMMTGSSVGWVATSFKLPRGTYRIYCYHKCPYHPETKSAPLAVTLR